MNVIFRLGIHERVAAGRNEEDDAAEESGESEASPGGSPERGSSLEFDEGGEPEEQPAEVDASKERVPCENDSASSWSWLGLTSTSRQGSKETGESAESNATLESVDRLGPNESGGPAADDGKPAQSDALQECTSEESQAAWSWSWRGLIERRPENGDSDAVASTGGGDSTEDGLAHAKSDALQESTEVLGSDPVADEGMPAESGAPDESPLHDMLAIVPAPDHGARIFLRERGTQRYLTVVEKSEIGCCVVLTELAASLFVCHYPRVDDRLSSEAIGDGAQDDSRTASAECSENERGQKPLPTLVLLHEGVPELGSPLVCRRSCSTGWSPLDQVYEATELELCCGSGDENETEFYWHPDATLQHVPSRHWMRVDPMLPDKVSMSSHRGSLWEALPAI